MLRPHAAVIAAALTLTACASQESAKPTTSTSTSGSTSTSTKIEMDAATFCQAISDAVPVEFSADGEPWRDFLDEVGDYAAPGPLISSHVDLLDAAGHMSIGPTGSDLLDARADVRAALSDMNTACRAEGSAALS